MLNLENNVDTKKLTLTIVFAAIAIALNPALTHIVVPAPFDPGLFYQVWEIPIVTAFLIISPLSGIAVCLLNTSALLILFPGALPTGPLYNMLACLSMQIGIYASITLGKKVHANKNLQTNNILASIKWLTAATATGILTRTTFMTIIHYFALPQPPPIGFGLNQVLTSAFLPLSALFNATLALYTIPIGWIIAHQVQKTLQPTNIQKTTKTTTHSF
jgi:riboflavin transporter FmnP